MITNYKNVYDILVFDRNESIDNKIHDQIG